MTIPRTYPSTLRSSNGLREMVVYMLPSIVGLTRWVDYIPIKIATTATRPNSYDTGGYIQANPLASISGLQSWVDYVPCYEDTSATDAWQCSLVGYIPVDNVFSPSTLFSSGEQGVWYDPSDFSTMYQDSAGTTPVTAVGQPVGIIADKHVRGGWLSRISAGVPVLNAAGTTPPTVSLTTFLGESARAIAMPITAGGFAVTRADGAGSASEFSPAAGSLVRVRYRYALSRALTGSETITLYATGASATTQVILTSSDSANAWTTSSYLSDPTRNAGVRYPVVFAGALTAPITVYVSSYEADDWAGSHVVQSTTTSRPMLQQPTYYADRFDGVDDGLQTATFAAGTLTTSMDVFVVMKRTAAQAGIIFARATSGNHVGCYDSADAVSSTFSLLSGTPSLLVNGTTVTNNRQALHTALGVGSWAVLEYQGCDLSNWTSAGISNYAGWYCAADVAGVVVCPAQSSTNRTNIRRYLGAKVGLSL